MSHPSSPATTLPGTHIIQSRNLTLEVMDPNSQERYNQGVRFSPVANVLKVRRAGKDYLAAPVEHDPLFHNGGLAMEFDQGNPSGPPGFNEAPMEGGFIKVGVGVLGKNRETYSFWPQYPIVELAQTRVEWEADRALYEQTCDGVNGYAYRLNAEVRVERSVVTVIYRLTNTGSRPFTSDQYAHNYFCFDGHPVGPGYTATFPHPIPAPAEGIPVLRRRPGTLVYPELLVKPANVTVEAPEGWKGPNQVRVRHAAKGMAVTVTTSLPNLRTLVHASAQYLSPQQYVLLQLEPNKTIEWTRAYEFGNA